MRTIMIYISIGFNIILVILCILIYLKNCRLEKVINNLFKEISWYKEIFLYYKNENSKLKKVSFELEKEVDINKREIEKIKKY